MAQACELSLKQARAVMAFAQKVATAKTASPLANPENARAWSVPTAALKPARTQATLAAGWPGELAATAKERAQLSQFRRQFGDPPLYDPVAEYLQQTQSQAPTEIPAPDADIVTRNRFLYGSPHGPGLRRQPLSRYRLPADVVERNKLLYGAPWSPGLAPQDITAKSPTSQELAEALGIRGPRQQALGEMATGLSARELASHVPGKTPGKIELGPPPAGYVDPAVRARAAGKNVITDAELQDLEHIRATLPRERTRAALTKPQGATGDTRPSRAAPSPATLPGAVAAKKLLGRGTGAAGPDVVAAPPRKSYDAAAAGPSLQASGGLPRQQRVPEPPKAVVPGLLSLRERLGPWGQAAALGGGALAAGGAVGWMLHKLYGKKKKYADDEVSTAMAILQARQNALESRIGLGGQPARNPSIELALKAATANVLQVRKQRLTDIISRRLSG
jgi:hypothetical protein